MARRNAAQQQLSFHPARHALIDEAHARPAQDVMPPMRVLHIAFRAPPEVCRAFFSTLSDNPAAQDNRHLSGEVAGYRVKLEYHTEFMSCTVFQDGKAARAGSATFADFLSHVQTLLPIEQTEILVFLDLDVGTTSAHLSASLPPGQRVYGGLLRDAIDVRSTFLPTDDEAIRFTLRSKGLTANELGRRLQRLIEMETYRTMALLGLKKARDAAAELTVIEDALKALTQQMTTAAPDNTDALPHNDNEALFAQISDLSERTNALATDTRYRFAASEAYGTLFIQRLDSLEERKVDHLQTMSGFLRSRFEPAIATIRSTAKRQDTLTKDLSRALILLRTRIELDLAKGDQSLLKSMDRRHDQQLKIAQTVEGLSIVAISYYAVGLVSYGLKAIGDQPWSPLSTPVLTAISVPFIIAAVWITLRRIRRAWDAIRSEPKEAE